MALSITKLAELAGVSPTTISRALSNRGYVNAETKERILQLAAEMGYQPKKYKKRLTSSSNIIGVVIPDIANSFFSEIIQGIEDTVMPKGYNIFICDSSEDTGKEVTCVSALQSRDICGLIIAAASDIAAYNTDYLKSLNDNYFPVVLIDRNLHIPGMDSVVVDNFGGAYSAVQALIDQGHTNIAILCGPTASYTGVDRLKGYIEALRKNSIPIREEYIMYGDYRLQSGYDLTKRLISSRKEITAIFACNRKMTIGCLKALTELGLKVPDDFAVISFGKADSDILYPTPISHIKHPVSLIGEEAAHILLSKIDSGSKYKKSPGKQSIFSTECVLCGSEKYPKNRKLL